MDWTYQSLAELLIAYGVFTLHETPGLFAIVYAGFLIKGSSFCSLFVDYYCTG